MNSIIKPFIELVNNKELIWEMSKKDISDRYKGQPLGKWWAIIHPLIIILVYIFLFGIVYQTRIGTQSQQEGSYAAYLLSGIVPWLTIQTSLSSGAISITSNRALVVQVVFPTSVLPVKMVGSALIVESVYIFLDLVYCTIYLRAFSLMYFLLPVAIILETLLLIGLNYMVAALNVYMRDIKDVVQVMCTLGIYLLPVIYYPDAVPSLFRKVLYINPLSHMIWVFQDILYFREIEHWYSWVISAIEAVFVFYFGDYLFRKLKLGFGSAL